MGLNEVFKKVADIQGNATELASHKVELATEFENFYKAQESVKYMYANGYNRIKESEKPLDSALKDLQMAKSAYERAVKVGMLLEDAIKKFGFPVPANYGSAKQRLFDDGKAIDYAINRVNKLKTEIHF
jgi:inorganic pyrophosphatase